MEITSATVLDLIHTYVGRQILVYELLSQLRPDILARFREGISVEKWLQMTKDYRQTPQSGVWGDNDEWDYFIHGGGCRLTHRQTKEPVEWDAPDLAAFDKYWFFNYIKWVRKNGNQEITSEITPDDHLQEVIFGILDQMVVEHKLTQSYTGYKLTHPTG